MAEAIGLIASIITIVQVSGKVAVLCNKYRRRVRRAQTESEELKKEVEAVKDLFDGVKRIHDGPHGHKLAASEKIRGAIPDIETLLQDLQKKLKIIKSRKVLGRLTTGHLKWPFNAKEAKAIIQKLQSHRQAVLDALNVDQTDVLLQTDVNVELVLRGVEQVLLEAILSKLPVVHGASYDSHADEYQRMCHPETRRQLLEEVMDWARNTQGPGIFCLNGMAGTGKSTIARTLVHRFAKLESEFIVVSFFFKRGETDRSGIAKLFSTLAAQLASAEPAMARHIKTLLETEPNIMHKTMTEQYETLFLKPVSAALAKDTTNQPPRKVMIVIDALDECERDEDIRLIIRLLSRDHTSESVSKFRLFVTSRPDLPMRLGFAAVSGTYKDLILQNIPTDVIKKDIAAFLQDEFTQIKTDYNSISPHRPLDSDWPDVSVIAALADMSSPLFIFAATTCRFVAETRIGNPARQLEKVLQQSTKSQESKLDFTYLPVLDQMVTGLSRTERTAALRDFRTVVGSLVLLENPLSSTSLAKLIDVPLETLENRFSHLHSILSVPDSSDLPVRILHLSFRDFLLDSNKDGSSEFWVDEPQTHEFLALSCLHVMSTSLKYDVCDVEWPGAERSSFSSQIAQEKLAPEVIYACRHWVDHLRRADMAIQDGGPIHKFLQSSVLHWIEALAWMGNMRLAAENIQELHFRAARGNAAQVYQFSAELSRFLRFYGNIVDSAPLQIYSSGLIFAPQESILRRTFDSKIRQWIPWMQYLPEIETNWEDTTRSFHGHGCNICMVIFSADSKLLASVDELGIVRIWHVDSGQQLHVLGTGLVEYAFPCIEFSRDSRYLLALYEDFEDLKDLEVRRMLNLWLVSTGELILQLNDGHDVNYATFSTDSKRLITINRQSSKADGVTVQVWCLSSSICVRQFQLMNCERQLSSYLSDEQRLLMYEGFIAVAKDKNLRTLQTSIFAAEVTMAQACLQEGSLSGQLLLLVPNFSIGTCNVYDIKTGDRIRSFQLENGGASQKTPAVMFVATMAICQDVVPLLLVWDDDYRTCVTYYDVKIHQQRQTFVFHTEISSLVPSSLSHDGQLMARPSDYSFVVYTGVDDNSCEDYELLPPASIAHLSYDECWVSLTTRARGASLLLDARTAEVKLRLPGCDGIQFSDDSQLLAISSLPVTGPDYSRRRVSIYNTQTLQKVLEFPLQFDVLQEIGFSEESSLLVTFTRQDDFKSRIQIHNVLSAGDPWEAEYPSGGEVGYQFALSARLAILAHSSLAFRVDNPKIFVHKFGSSPGYYIILLEHTETAKAMAFSNHSNFLAAICGSTYSSVRIRIWDANAGQCMYIIRPENESLPPLTSTFNRFRYLYSRCQVLDANSGKLSRTIVPHASAGIHGFNPFDAELHAGINPLIKPVEVEHSAPSMAEGRFAANLPVLGGSDNPGVSSQSVSRHSASSLDLDGVVLRSNHGISFIDERKDKRIENDDGWLRYHGSKLLWLPYDCRPDREESVGNTAVITTRRGKIFIIRLSAEHMPMCEASILSR